MNVPVKEQKYTSKSLKNRQLTYKNKVEFGFNYKFAGCCEVFISVQKNGYLVITSGFDIDNGIVFFNKNAYSRTRCKTLYNAIQFFIYVINTISYSLDWYTPDFFDSEEFYNIANERIYK